MQRSARLTIGLLAAAVAFATVVPGAPAGATVYSYFVYPQGGGVVDYTESLPRPGQQGIVGDFVGGADAAGSAEDIFWYTPGPGGDAMWRMLGDRGIASSAQSVSGTFTPLVLHDDGDQKDDIFWYAPGPAPDSLWDFNADGSITKTAIAVNGAYEPLVGFFDGDSNSDILWYGPGSAADTLWRRSSPTGFTATALAVNGNYTPVVNRVAGIGSPSFDAADDVLWYAPGPGGDALWDFNGDGSVTKLSLTINGTYTIVPGYFAPADGYGDLLFYAPGSAPDSLWDFNGGTTRSVTSLSINGTYAPYPCACASGEDATTDIVWFAPGSASDVLWEFAPNGTRLSTALQLSGTAAPVIGRFESGVNGREGILVND